MHDIPSGILPDGFHIFCYIATKQVRSWSNKISEIPEKLKELSEECLVSALELFSDVFSPLSSYAFFQVSFSCSF